MVLSQYDVDEIFSSDEAIGQRNVLKDWPDYLHDGGKCLCRSAMASGDIVENSVEVSNLKFSIIWCAYSQAKQSVWVTKYY